MFVIQMIFNLNQKLISNEYVNFIPTVFLILEFNQIDIPSFAKIFLHTYLMFNNICTISMLGK